MIKSLFKKLYNRLTAQRVKIGGVYTVSHYRDGKLIYKSGPRNLVVDQGLIYAINSAFGVPVGGAPAPKAQFYLGIGTSSPVWVAGDLGSAVSAKAIEFNTYNSNSNVRPSWTPAALAVAGTVELSNAGDEMTYIIGDLSGIGGSTFLRNGFLIDTTPADGTGDATSTLISAVNFPSPREVFTGDTFKIGYVFKAESGSL